MDKIRVYLIGLYDYLFALLIFLLPFSNAIPNILLLGLVAIYTIDLKKENLTIYRKSPFVLLAALALYLLIQAAFNGSLVGDMDYYKKYGYLILIPLLFLKVRKYQIIKIAAIIAVNASIVISVYKIMKFYRAFGYVPMVDGWATNFVLLLERPYAGLFSLISIIISFDLYSNSVKKRYLYLISMLVSIGFIFAISIRTSILTLFLLLFIYILFYFKVKIKQKAYIFSGLLLALVVLFMLNQNIAKRFFLKDSIGKTIETTRQMEPRVIIFDCANQIAHESDFSILFGAVSYSGIQNKLNTCFGASISDYSRRNWFLEQHFNTHSQFIDLFLIGGIIAFFLFTLFMGVYFIAVRGNFIAVSVIVTFMMILLIENIFHRQFGCLIFTIFTALYFIEDKVREND